MLPDIIPPAIITLVAIPPAIITRWNTELNRALADPGLNQRLIEQGVEAMPGTPEAFRKLIVEETARWRGVIKTAGITAENTR